MPIFDQFHDPGYGRLKHLLASHPGAVELLKTASIEDTEPDLPAGAYAWPERRLFPVHSAEHAALSHLYAKTAEAEIPGHVTARLDEALLAYDVPTDAFDRSRDKVASDDESLFPGGAYPVRNADEVKTAEARLLPQLHKLDGSERLRVFGKLASAAEVHGVKLAARSLQLACKTSVHTGRLADHLEARAAKTSDPELSGKYAALAVATRKAGRALDDVGTRRDLASVIHKLDKTAGLEALYDKDLDDAASTVSNTTKLAEESCNVGGRTFTNAQLGRIPMELYKQALGDDIERAIGKGGKVDEKLAAEVLPTLPAEMSRMFAKLVSRYRL